MTLLHFFSGFVFGCFTVAAIPYIYPSDNDNPYLCCCDGGEKVVFPFGKHKGLCVCELPTGYLNWLVKKNIIIRRDLQRHARVELNKRTVK